MSASAVPISPVPYERCHATKQELLLIPGKTVESFCAACQDFGVYCRVSFHPSAPSQGLSLLSYFNYFSYSIF